MMRPTYMFLLFILDFRGDDNSNGLHYYLQAWAAPLITMSCENNLSAGCYMKVSLFSAPAIFSNNGSPFTPKLSFCCPALHVLQYTILTWWPPLRAVLHGAGQRRAHAVEASRGCRRPTTLVPLLIRQPVSNRSMKKVMMYCC
jgi:hypothetical protein